MLYSDVIGQQAAKQRIVRMVTDGHLPHAVLLSGGEGRGKLPLALALASHLLCQHPTTEGMPCGKCQSCLMAQGFAHPDWHFVVPVIKPAGQTSPPTTDQYLPQWTAMLKESVYADHATWLERMGVANQQATIGVAEAARLLQKLELLSSQNGAKVVVIWQAERLQTETTNKLLKLIEDPPPRTYFILTSAHPERLLPTLLSRMQRIQLPPISEADLAAAISERHGLESDAARSIARASEGNYNVALRMLTFDNERAQMFDRFTMFMRLCYMRKVKDLHEWSMEMASWGRERQRAFLTYALHLVRENFAYNFHEPELLHLEDKEAAFSKNFARFINERNVIDIAAGLENAIKEIGQNVNPKMVFFDFSLKMIVWLLQ